MVPSAILDRQHWQRQPITQVLAVVSLITWTLTGLVLAWRIKPIFSKS